MSIQSLKKLQVWARAKDFAVKVYKKVLPLLPPEEKWSLNQQLRRSSTSVSANIAEGHGRFYFQENVRFCYNARGSLEETLSHLIFCFEVDMIPEALYKELENEGEEIEKMLNGYIAFLKKSRQGENEPGANYKSVKMLNRMKLALRKTRKNLKTQISNPLFSTYLFSTH